MHPWSLTSGPTYQPGPLARTQRGENSGEPEFTAAGLFRRTKRSYTFYGSRRTQRTYLRGLKQIGASSPPATAERWRCSLWPGHAAVVERTLTAGIGAQGQGETNAPKNARNGGVEGENRADRGVAGAPTHSSELYRTRGTHRARLSAST